MESSNISKYSSGEAHFYLSESKRLARQYALRVKSFDARVIMDRTKIAGHAVELGYFENLDSAVNVVRTTTQAHIYQTLMISDLNSFYMTEATVIMTYLAEGNITGVSDKPGAVIQALGAVVSDVGIVSAARNVLGFANNTIKFSEILSNSDDFENNLLKIEIDAGIYYAKNCGRLRC